MEDRLKAIVFELPRPEDLEEGRLDRIVADLRATLAHLPTERVRQVLSFRGRPGLLLHLSKDELGPACARVREILDAERIEYVEHLYYGEPRTMAVPPAGLAEPAEPGWTPKRRRRELKRLLEGGHAFCRMDLFGDARVQFQAAHTLDPDCAEALYGLALVEAREGRDEICERLLRRALSLDSQKSAYQLALGRLYYRAGRLEEAEQAARQAVALAPRDPLSYDLLGWTCLDLGQVERAVSAFREALERSPSQVSSLCGMGSALYAEGHLEESAEFLDQALAEEPAT